MSERTVALARVAEAERAALSASLDSLEERMEKLTDWRHVFRTHTGPALGLAFGAGVVLAAATGGRERLDYKPSSVNASSRRQRRGAGSQGTDWVGELASTAVGIAGTYLMRYVTRVLAEGRTQDRPST